jgi:hypothetical protein
MEGGDGDLDIDSSVTQHLSTEDGLGWNHGAASSSGPFVYLVEIKLLEQQRIGEANLLGI